MGEQQQMPQQRFCTTCGQPLAAGMAFCVSCGAPVNAPPPGAGQFPAGAQPGVPPPYQPGQPYTPYSQTPAQGAQGGQEQDDPLLAALAAVAMANQMRMQQASPAAQRRWSRPWGCGCILLTVVLLAGPLVGFALTTGRLHLIFLYGAGGMVALLIPAGAGGDARYQARARSTRGGTRRGLPGCHLWWSARRRVIVFYSKRQAGSG